MIYSEDISIITQYTEVYASSGAELPDNIEYNYYHVPYLPLFFVFVVVLWSARLIFDYFKKR